MRRKLDQEAAAALVLDEDDEDEPDDEPDEDLDDDLDEPDEEESEDVVEGVEDDEEDESLEDSDFFATGASDFSAVTLPGRESLR